MPTCKNCHSRIDKFNKDRCPICGVERPFEGVSSDTVEVTSRIDSGDVKIDYHPRKRKTLLTLFVLCGFLGIPFFYLRKHVAGIIYAISFEKKKNKKEDYKEILNEIKDEAKELTKEI